MLDLGLKCIIGKGIDVTIGFVGREPRGRGNSVNEEFESEVMIEEKSMVINLVDDLLLPLEDLQQQLLSRRHFSL